MSDPFTVSGSLDADDQFEPVEAGVHQGVLAALIFRPEHARISRAARRRTA